MQSLESEKKLVLVYIQKSDTGEVFYVVFEAYEVGDLAHDYSFSTGVCRYILGSQVPLVGGMGLEVTAEALLRHESFSYLRGEVLPDFLMFNDFTVEDFAVPGFTGTARYASKDEVRTLLELADDISLANLESVCNN